MNKQNVFARLYKIFDHDCDGPVEFQHGSQHGINSCITMMMKYLPESIINMVLISLEKRVKK